MKINFHKNLIILITAIFVIGFFFYSRLQNSKQHKVYVVIETENGFSPDHITIKQGDIIKFVTARNKSFWPASNLHPSHEIYPEFDSKKPIDPTSSWSFRFDKVGEWRDHDHLAPFITGTIIVKN